MATAKKKASKTHIKNSDTIPEPVHKKMRKNTKVARVSCYCKLNMLVPHLQSLSSRMQPEHKHEKARAGYNANS